MLHDPMRTHSRATLVGAVLSVLGMIGFVVFGLFSSDPEPSESGIVIGEPSGSIYVMAGEQEQLVPTFNLASARLLLMSQQSEGEEGGGDSSAGGEVVDPEVVSDEQLEDFPRGRLHGIPDGPELLPSEDQLISSDWAVCDEVDIKEDLTDSVAREEATTETTVFGGVQDVGDELAENEALLVHGDNDKDYLIYRQDRDPNNPNANTVRAEIDLDEPAVSKALGLDQDKARDVSTGLLNAVPEAGELKVPDIPESGQDPDGFSVQDLQVGAVFATEPVDDKKEYYVVLSDGVQKISKAVARVLRVEHTVGDDNIPTVPPDAIRDVQVDEEDDGPLDVAHYPQGDLTVLDPKQHPVGCLGWEIKGEGEQRDSSTTVYVGSVLPGPDNGEGESELVKIGAASPQGEKIDHFYMRPGHAAAVRSAETKETFERGSIQLISDRGMRYGIPDVETAEGLGLSDLRPAPESIISLLPVGSSLNTQDVQRTFDGVPVQSPPEAAPGQDRDDQANASIGN